MSASNDSSPQRIPQTVTSFSENSPATVAERAEGPSIDPADVARFSAQAAQWWDPKGPFAPLHRFNPARLRFVRDRVSAHYGLDTNTRAPFAGMSLIDIGCGGGLIAEPMRRMGFDVTALDASSENIGTARAHAQQVGLDIRYKASTVEQLVEAGEARSMWF